MNFLYPLYIAFGWILDQMYAFFGNYGLVILLFTVVLKTLLIPFSFKSTKMMMKQQALAPELDALKREYKDDKMGFSEAQMALFKKHNISMAGGCLPSLLGILIIWPIFRIVTAPLTYISQVSFENLEKIGQYLMSRGLLEQAQIDRLSTNDIPINQVLSSNADALAKVVNDGLISLSDILNMNFMGMDMGLVPSFMPQTLFGSEWRTYLPLLIIPVVAVASAFLTSYVMEITNPNYKKLKEERELAKKNPARQTPTGPAATSVKMMKYMMPLITIFTTFTSPAALGLYWIASNLMMIVQQVLVYFIYKKRSQEEI